MMIMIDNWIDLMMKRMLHSAQHCKRGNRCKQTSLPICSIYRYTHKQSIPHLRSTPHYHVWCSIYILASLCCYSLFKNKMFCYFVLRSRQLCYDYSIEYHHLITISAHTCLYYHSISVWHSKFINNNNNQIWMWTLQVSYHRTNLL